MNLQKVILFLWFFITLSHQVEGQTLVNESVNYTESIKTIQFTMNGMEVFQPILSLNASEVVELSFDDLDSDLKRYRYTFYHCDADWSISPDLTESDYISGVREGTFEQFKYSVNTTVTYTHYSLNFPEEQMRPKISGNYILKVYNDEPTQVVFTRRFVVVESSPVVVTGKVNQASNAMDKFTRQEVDFDVRLNGFRVSDASREIKVVLVQNERIDNALTTLKPRFIRMDDLDYNYDEENTFNGGNEFRNFDIRSLRYQTERINTIQFEANEFHVILLTDPLKTVKNYTLEKDYNGKRIIKSDDNAENSAIEADYTWVTFTLPMETPVANGQIYIGGTLTDWQCDEGSRMVYNASIKAYQKSIFLKQGYYNYIYLIKDLKSGKLDETFTEGNHWETENQYQLFVYFRQMGGSYDRLIAVEEIKR